MFDKNGLDDNVNEVCPVTFLYCDRIRAVFIVEEQDTNFMK